MSTRDGPTAKKGTLRTPFPWLFVLRFLVLGYAVLSIVSFTVFSVLALSDVPAANRVFVIVLQFVFLGGALLLVSGQRYALFAFFCFVVHFFVPLPTHGMVRPTSYSRLGTWPSGLSLVLPLPSLLMLVSRGFAAGPNISVNADVRERASVQSCHRQLHHAVQPHLASRGRWLP
jgi:hypothetical protein